MHLPTQEGVYMKEVLKKHICIALSVIMILMPIRANALEHSGDSLFFYALEAWNLSTTPGAISLTTPASISPRMGIIVNFDANGGQLLGGHDQRTTATGDIVSGTVGMGNMPISPTNPGFMFAQWNTMQNGNGEIFTGDTVVYAVDSPLTVYAQWGAELSFGGNGVTLFTGTDPNNATHFMPRIVPVNRSVAETAGVAWPNNPVRPGYTFVGWYDTLALNGGTRFTEDSVISINTVVHARWQLNPAVTVTFDPSSGTISPGHTGTRLVRQGLSIRTSWNSPHYLNRNVQWEWSAPQAQPRLLMHVGFRGFP